MQGVAKYAIFSVLICVSAILCTLASFSNLKYTQPNIFLAVAVASAFAVLEYSFKVPAYKMVRDDLSPAHLHIIWIVTTFVVTNLFQTVFLKKNVSFRHWVVAVIFSFSLAWILVTDSD